MLARWCKGTETRAFAGWRANVTLLKATREKTRSILVKWMHAHLASAYATWLEQLELAKRGRAIVSRVLLRWTRNTLVRAVVRWQESLIEARRLQKICARVLMRWSKQELARSFSQWKERKRFNTKFEQTIKKMAKYLRKWMNMQLSKCFDTLNFRTVSRRYPIYVHTYIHYTCIHMYVHIYVSLSPPSPSPPLLSVRRFFPLTNKLCRRYLHGSVRALFCFHLRTAA